MTNKHVHRWLIEDERRAEGWYAHCKGCQSKRVFTGGFEGWEISWRLPARELEPVAARAPKRLADEWEAEE